MSKIIIEVDSDVQEAFEQASEAEKQEIKCLISVFFRQSLASKNLVEVMEEIGVRAEARGLTPEILADILEDTDGEPSSSLCFPKGDLSDVRADE